MDIRRLITIGDLPGDDDDTLLRKRAGVAAGYITIFAPLTLPLEAPGQPAALPLALVLSSYSAINLVVLARTKRFERFVIALIATGPVFVLAATAVSGGVLTGSSGLVWAFLVPGYAILALGPRRSTPWYFAFIATVLVGVATDPLMRQAFSPPPYAQQLIFTAQNIGAPLTVAYLLLRYTDLRRRAAEARSDELLTNAIPPSIASRLKHGENRIAEAFPETTVLFADIVGFTPWAQRTDPARVVAMLDDLFSRFDALALDHGVEKIKTVGDAYMVVAGAPEPRADHATAALAFARAILTEEADWSATNALNLEIRVGLASGPVVGGIIGRRRLQFDLWGDTVNTAARMESSGVPGRIQLAPSTHELLDAREAFEPRQVEVKGLGPMTTYVTAQPLNESSRVEAEARSDARFPA
jgi:adenylate cyclase